MRAYPKKWKMYKLSDELRKDIEMNGKIIERL